MKLACILPDENTRNGTEVPISRTQNRSSHVRPANAARPCAYAAHRAQPACTRSHSAAVLQSADGTVLHPPTNRMPATGGSRQEVSTARDRRHRNLPKKQKTDGKRIGAAGIGILSGQTRSRPVGASHLRCDLPVTTTSFRGRAARYYKAAYSVQLRQQTEGREAGISPSSVARNNYPTIPERLTAKTTQQLRQGSSRHQQTGAE